MKNVPKITQITLWVLYDFIIKGNKKEYIRTRWNHLEAVINVLTLV